MSAKFNPFKQLHEGSRLFLLPNAWNAKSAQLFEAAGLPAIGTSSAAVADSLGYPDGEGMPFQEYLFIVQRILSAVKVPVTVDIEMGYGHNKETIWNNIRRLVELGVAGINIEDSSIDGAGRRSLKEARLFAHTLEYLRKQLAVHNSQLFINVRCDTFILGINNALTESLTRVATYEAAGADGIFLPCIADENDIAAITSSTPLPLNVMCIPGLPGFDVLNRLGVKRASMGPFLFQKLYGRIAPLSSEVLSANSFAAILS